MTSSSRSNQVFCAVAAVLLAAPLQMGCAPSESSPEGVGAVRVAITTVPAGVNCISLTAMGATRTASQSFDVTPAASSVLLLPGVPTGQVVFSGEAFGAACASLTPGAAASWVSDPVTTQIAAGTTADVTLTMRRNGSANVHVDFQDDSNPNPFACTNTVRDGNESDVDCGGGTCPTCATGRQCRVGSDCASGSCTAGVCGPGAGAATTTTLVSSANPAVFGQRVTLTATVIAANGLIPTGSVLLRDGTTPIIIVALEANGAVPITFSSLGLRTHLFIVDYMPTGAFQASTSNTVVQTANQAATATTLAVPSAFVLVGGQYFVQTGSVVTFDAHVTAQAPGAGTPTGNVVLSLGGTDITSMLAAGATSVITTLSTAGPATLTASYGGDLNFTASVSPPLQFQVVDQLPAGP